MPSLIKEHHLGQEKPPIFKTGQEKPPIFKASTTNTVIISFFVSILLYAITPPPPKSTYHSLYVSFASNATIPHHLLSLTRRPHVAGSPANAAAAAHVLSTLSSSVIRTRTVSYDVSLSFPVSRSLTLALPHHPPATFLLLQEPYAGDPHAGVAAQAIPTFHAYARSGSVTGHVAYVNYGRVEDFETLTEMGVNVSGAVVLARYGKGFRGDIIRNAHDAGAVGLVLYTDSKGYGGSGGGGERWFPDEEWMPPSGVQVGTVYSGCGDPTTPGWPSTRSCERTSDEQLGSTGWAPTIPSLPVSSADGEAILRSIGGHIAPDDWRGGAHDLVYRVGPGPGLLNLTYNVRESMLGKRFAWNLPQGFFVFFLLSDVYVDTLNFSDGFLWYCELEIFRDPFGLPMWLSLFACRRYSQAFSFSFYSLLGLVTFVSKMQPFGVFGFH